jgi:hypothetical protein
MNLLKLHLKSGGEITGIYQPPEAGSPFPDTLTLIVPGTTTRVEIRLDAIAPPPTSQ